jgi:FkbM family methyltransferase
MVFRSLGYTLKFLVRHPLSKGRLLDALGRYVRWQIGSRLVPGPVATEFVNGSMLLARPGMAGATGNIYGGLHEFEDMAFVLHFLRPGDLFVDIGANIGSYSILASAGAGADCLAFEPNPKTFEWLRRNIDLNGLMNKTEAHCKALGSLSGEAEFTVDLDAGNHLVPDVGLGSEHTQIVPLTTLDEAINGRSPSILKIDVEGFETEVINGAQSTLSSPDLRCIIMEFGGLGEKFGFDEQALIKRIKALGFSEYAYFPFERRLSKQGEEKLAANVIFVRDLPFVENRLRNAVAFSILGRDI